MNKTENPFLGLRPFEVDNARIFFGRDEETAMLKGLLRRVRFLAVLGDSGCGKSSLVRAGLIGALREGFMVGRSGSWLTAVMRPGDRPIEELAKALSGEGSFKKTGRDQDESAAILQATLRRGQFGLIEAVKRAKLPPGARLLILVDQFEELFRMTEKFGVKGEDEAREFTKLLLEAAAQRDLPIYVVLTMRAEFLGKCGDFTGLPEAIGNGLYLVPQMRREHLRKAIKAPIELFGGKITEGLVNRLLNDSSGKKDQLPLLQHALMRMWSEWLPHRNQHTIDTIHTIDTSDYEKIGKLEGALFEHLKETYQNSLSTRQRQIATRVFESLVAVTEEKQIVRKPESVRAIRKNARADLKEVSDVISILRAPGRSFLTTSSAQLSDDSIVDISHESLIRNWEPLKELTAVLARDQSESGGLQTLVVPGQLGPSEKTSQGSTRIVDATVRGMSKGEYSVAEGVMDTDVIELEFETGTKQILSVAQLREELAKTDPNLITNEREFRVPPVGLSGKLKTLKILNLDSTETAHMLSARGAMEKWESRLKPGFGLYRYLSPTKPGEQITSRSGLDAVAPYLIFIHDTALNCAGSFGALDSTAEWENLRGYYGDRILAFEHRTLSQGPIQNAIDLAMLLPAGAKLHFATLGRGGLVGELFCVPPVTNQAGIDRLVRPFAADNRTEDEQQIRQLADLLARKNFEIERFVRVASPMRGTNFITQRLDRYFSFMLNTLSATPELRSGQSYDFIKVVALELAKRRSVPDELPGLEAQTPASPLIRLLNDPDLSTRSNLTVIAGVFKGAGPLAPLKDFATSVFFTGDHDLMVNTQSMYGGLRREHQVLFFLDEGPNVTHFNFFTNRVTREKFVAALTGRNDPGFKPLVRGEVELDRLLVVPRTTADDRASIFLLPGIMGSHLRDQNGRVWLDSMQLARGGMERLKMDSKRIAAEGLLAEPYKRLIGFLQPHYNVVPFAYDWRLSLQRAADELEAEVERRLKSSPHKILFLAHGEGGLVVRAMIARNRALWNSICERDGRLIMLGTPNRGTFFVLRLLLGQDKMSHLLPLLDIKHDSGDLLEIMRQYPGFLEVLPDEFLTMDRWKFLKGVKPPASEALLLAKQTRDQLETASNAGGMLYVAGSASNTPCGVQFAEGAIVFESTERGDGRVTHEQSRLEGARMWYLNVRHGDLVNHEPAFPAFLELLEGGKTDKLEKTPQAERSTGATNLLRDNEEVLFPTEEELIASALGGEVARADAAQAYPLRVSVAHGHLRYAKHPVVVGHYQGDSIVGTEKVLDQALNGQLLQRLGLGLYPGLEGTSEVIQAAGCELPGALVIGLGEFGEITPEKVRDGVAMVALRHALAVLSGPSNNSNGRWRSAAFSSLLVGASNGEALSIRDSVTAIVQGAVQANRALQEQGLWDRVRVDVVEIIELYEDIAIQASRIAQELMAHPPTWLAKDEKVKAAPYLQTLEGGEAQRPANQSVSGWWSRLQVTGAREDDAQAGLIFLSTTGRVRMEDVVGRAQKRLVDNFIAKTVQTSHYDERFGATLFELLTPNSVRAQTGTQTDLLLVVDREAAQYPWEMLAERRGEEVQPLALGRGIVRQFRTTGFRLSPQRTPERNALIIGDTANDISPLPGAQREAEDVAAVLGDQFGSDCVKLLVRRNALDILTELFARDYKIIHLAGHGVYDPAEPYLSGMTLSDESILSAAELSHLRVVPDLVFINCCHLGRIDESSEQARSDLTSELARVLARMGLAKLAPILAEKLIKLGLAAMDDPNELRANIERELIADGVPDTDAPDILAARLVRELTRLRVSRNDHNKFAANISEELIRMGVRAVVAAGWAVDDAAASTFAKTFYARMLGGESFGAAVLDARKTTAELHPLVNTWGAYQCYGSPDFRLVHSPPTGKWKRELHGNFISRREYLNSLRNTAAAAKDADAQRRAALSEQVAELWREIQPQWLDGEMLSAFGAAWAELGDLEKAIEHFRQALQAESGGVSLRDIEQLANLESRLARKLLIENTPPATRREGRALFDASNDRLEQLLKIGETTERLALLAANHKSMARSVTGAAQVRELRAARDAYRRAHDLALQETGEVDYYPALNWAACSWLVGDAKDRKNKSEIIEIIESAKAFASKRPYFWNRVAEADAELLRHLVDGDLTKTANQQKVIEKYQRAMGSGTSREASALLDQVNFLISLHRPAKSSGRQKQQTEALLRIRAECEKMLQ